MNINRSSLLHSYERLNDNYAVTTVEVFFLPIFAPQTNEEELRKAFREQADEAGKPATIVFISEDQRYLIYENCY